MTNDNGRDGGGGGGAQRMLTLEARPERRLIRPTGSRRHVDFAIRVQAAPPRAEADRPSLSLALVLDRSGSMQGEKLATAKRAALAVLDHLEERDRVAVVVFDDRVDVVQAAGPATDLLKAHVRAELDRVEARASTALHEGWLTGCQAIASTDQRASDAGVSRCFLLTDGLANVGLQDPEQIAAQAGEVRARTRIGTSTFGVGADYAEGLLGPMAVAGGGQFHHLPAASQIAATFVGELGGLLAVAASQVRLELESDPLVTAEVISQYWAEPGDPHAARRAVSIGDLIGGEERHVVVRFGFPVPQGGREQCLVRARLAWRAAGEDHLGAWQELRFSYAGQGACDDEPRDAAVMHWVGLAHADRAQLEATQRSNRGDLDGARRVLEQVTSHIEAYRGDDPALAAAVKRLGEVKHDMASAPLAPMAAKEMYYQSQRASRGQSDYRRPEAP